MSSPPPSLALIGAGHVGMNLLRHCLRQGIPVTTVVESSAPRLERVRDLHPDASLATALPAEFPSDLRYCIIAVPDGAIAGIAGQLAAMTPHPTRLVVFHCSGSLDSSVLAPVARTGCMTGSIHPMMSFHADSLPAPALHGIGCGIEGNDAFWDEGRRLAERMDWRPLRINAERKSLYHAANVFAGNFPTVLASMAETLLRASAADASSANISHLFPMMHAVLERLANTPPQAALTGPAARGELETIHRHLDALEEQDPKFRDVYDALTRVALTMRER